MSNKHSQSIWLTAALSDFIILNLSFVVSFLYINNFGNAFFETPYLLLYIYINITWYISTLIFQSYSIQNQINKKEIIYASIKSLGLFFFMFLMFFQIVSINYFSTDIIKILFPAYFGLLITWKLFLFFAFYFYRKMGYNYRNVVILGCNKTTLELRDYFTNNTWAGYRFKGIFTEQKTDTTDVIGTYSDLESFFAKNDIDEIYILANEIKNNSNNTISSIISKYPVKLRIVPDLSTFSYMKIKLNHFDTLPIMQIQQGPLSYWRNRIIKRIFDIGFSFLIIVFVLSWLIPLIFISNLINGETDIFFVQKRKGLNNKTFNCIKFRSMSNNNLSEIKQATENDQRITILGKFLRKNSIDEMPQFFNVFVGQMSVVGPRPHMLMHTEQYKKLVQKFMIRHTIKPGITGHAQVRGFRGEIKQISDMEQRVKFDVTYIENWSIWLDIKIIFLTIASIFTGDKKAY